PRGGRRSRWARPGGRAVVLPRWRRRRLGGAGERRAAMSRATCCRARTAPSDEKPWLLSLSELELSKVGGPAGLDLCAVDKRFAIAAPFACVATPELELDARDYFVDDEGATGVGNNLIRTVDKRMHPQEAPLQVGEVDVDAAHRLAGPVDDGSPNNATGAQLHYHWPFLVALERE